MKRRAYAKYKPSGIEWLDDVPEHWEVRRLKHVAFVQFSSVDKHTIENEEPVRLCNYVDVYYNDFITEAINFMTATGTRSEITRFKLRRGDVLITKDSESWDDIAVPAYVADELDGVVCGYHLAHIRPDLRKLLGKYLFRAFRARGVNDQFRVAATGITRYGLGKYWLDNGLFPLPPLPEQRAIAAFLDRETARVDTLIEKKRRQIELLQEKRSALISHAVTKGLNPDAPMKDSGIPGWQSVPSHWRVTQLRHLTQPGRAIMYGIVLPGPHVDDGVPIVKGGNCEPGRLQLDKMSRTTHEIESRYVRSRLSPGDIVYAIRGSIGEAEIVPAELDGANMTQDAARIAPLLNVDNRWLLFAVRSCAFFSHLDAHATGATIRGINIWDLKRAPICVPPVAEQAAIAGYLMCEITRHDSLVTKLGDSISKLREFRTALVSAAVTGQIDVRKEVQVGQEEEPG